MSLGGRDRKFQRFELVKCGMPFSCSGTLDCLDCTGCGEAR